jgi:hypothetical protein
MSNEELMLQLEALRSENQALKASKIKPFSMKVSEKGAVSVYGLGRFPVTLYRGQWERLLSEDNVVKVKSFIEANAEKLKVKE